MKIIADDKIPFLRGVLEPFADVVYMPGSKISRADLTDTDGLLIRTRTRCNEALLHGTSVKFIGTATIGYDHIDTGYCDARNIKWINAPGCNSSSVQQYIAAALLKLSVDEGFKLKNKTLGIVGVGNVGSKVEKIAGILGMKVLLNDPPRERKEGSDKFVSFEKILRESDIITLHVPLNRSGDDKTYHLISGEVFRSMGKKAWLINSSRGEVVDTESIKIALKNGLLAGAILDVWENEPDIDRELLSATYISTPHIAGYSTDGKAKGTSMVVNSLCRFFKLPLTDWYPENIPHPGNKEIEIDCSAKSDEEIVGEAVKVTYDIASDHFKLRQSPDTFEKQRGDYGIRREFQSYRIVTGYCSRELNEKLIRLGFSLASE